LAPCLYVFRPELLDADLAKSRVIRIPLEAPSCVLRCAVPAEPLKVFDIVLTGDPHGHFDGRTSLAEVREQLFCSRLRGIVALGLGQQFEVTQTTLFRLSSYGSRNFAIQVPVDAGVIFLKPN
jgi:hypothetical protein